MSARQSSDITKSPDRGFTLVELLIVMLIAGLLLAGFTAFYLSEQRSLRHHQIEIEISQALRTALEQMTRDIRSARKDITKDLLTGTSTANPTFLAATATNIEFQLDANDDGTITSTDTNEHKGFQLNGSAIEQYDASTGTGIPLASVADVTPTLAFAYFACDGTALTAPVATPNNIASVTITLTMTRAVAVGGLPVSRTESEQVKLRNVRCS